MQQLINFFNNNFYNICVYCSILFIPVRIFYKNVFSFKHACGFAFGIAVPIYYIYIAGESGNLTLGTIAGGVFICGIFVLYGLYCLFEGWTCCKNIIHAIFMPAAMLCEVGAFILVLALFLLGIGVGTQGNDPPYSIRRDDDDDY